MDNMCRYGKLQAGSDFYSSFLHRLLLIVVVSIILYHRHQFLQKNQSCIYLVFLVTIPDLVV